jgi:hypothetical protein
MKQPEYQKRIMKSFRLAYRETDKTRTRIRNLDNRIGNFKCQGKVVPPKLVKEYRTAMLDNARWYTKECALRDTVEYLRNVKR